jgi:hypothetical protein
MILFFNVRACESRMIPGSAGMLPALSGILPDSMQRRTACNMKTPRNGPRQHAGGSGQNARAPQLL